MTRRAEGRDRVDVCWVISHGFAARMVMHSGILPALRERGVRVGLVLPNAEEPQVQELAEREDFVAIPAPDLPGRFRGEYDRLRRYVFEDVRSNPALWAKHLRDRRAEGLRGTPRRWRARFYLALHDLASRVGAARSLLSRVERRMLSDEGVRRTLADVGPRLVVSTYPVSPLEAAFLHEARRASVRTVIQLLSWDNITCKGRFSVLPDHFLSWGPVMTEEFVEHYGFPRDRIVECGVPHFDAHATTPPREEVRALVSELGLDPDVPYLFFGMSSPYFAPGEIDVVEWLAGRVESGRFGERLQLVVRPHPQNVRGSTADRSWLPRLRALGSERVAVDFPRTEESSLAWSLREEDLGRLSNLLAGCAVSLNSGSTLSLDAIARGKPVVMTPFDGPRNHPWWRSARRVEEYPHISKLLEMGGVAVARSFAELGGAIERYLDDPSLDEEGRRRSRDLELGPVDGEASRRAAEAIVDVLDDA